MPAQGKLEQPERKGKGRKWHGNEEAATFAEDAGHGTEQMCEARGGRD
jgi:hypothetical protein